MRKAAFRLGPASASSLWVFLALGACATDSGQTGSPVSEPPEYETPGRQPPAPPGGGTDDGAGEGEAPEQVLPRPVPAPGSTALIGDRLLVAARGSLSVLDASADPPSVVGRLPIEGEPTLLHAHALDRLVLSVRATPHGATDQIPTEPIARERRALLHVDASDPASPRLAREDLVPEGAAGVVVREGGYTALGARFEAAPFVACGAALDDIARPPPLVSALWLERFGPDASEGEARRELGPGHFQLSSDGAHLLRLSAPASTPVASDVEVEVVSVATLETVYRVTIGASAFGAEGGAAPSVDYADGVLIAAAGPRLLAFDAASGQPLLPLSTAATIFGVRFLDAQTIGLEGTGVPLVKLDRDARTLSAVPVSGAAVTGALIPFGSGYIALEGIRGSGELPHLRATTYSMSEGGELQMTSQLQTDWFFSTRGHVDSAGGRVTHGVPIDDSDGGHVGVIELHEGQLRASNLEPVDRVALAPLIHGDTVLAFAGGVLEPLQLAGGAAGLSLEREAPMTLALDRVWFEVEHAGLLWARHRKDTGESFLSARGAPFSEPTYIQLGHAVDAIVPLDAAHVAVLGLATPGICDTLLARNPQDSPECKPGQGNGISVLAVASGAASVVRSFPLSSFMEGEPPPGIERSLNWQGYFEAAPGRWALIGTALDECSSEAACAELGVPTYRSRGTRSCNPQVETCQGGIVELVSGYLAQSWMFVLDVTDPEAPELSPAVREGLQYRAGNEEMDLGDRLLGYARSAGTRVWGYPHREEIYDASGNSIDDGHGGSLARWSLQLATSDTSGVRFEDAVNVPGEVVWLEPGPSDDVHTAFSLEQRYRDGAGEPFVALNRLRVEGGGAWIEESAELSSRLLSARGAPGRIALLEAPPDYCAEGARYALRVADVSGAPLTVSAPLTLPAAGGWALGAVREADLLELTGGPAGHAGRLEVDMGTDPPSVVRYVY